MTDGFDQTRFMNEEPLFERPIEVPKTPTPELVTQESESTPPRSRKKLLIIAGGLGCFILLMLVLLIIVMTGKRTAPPVTEETITAQEEEAVGPFLQRLRELDTELDAADPTQAELPFPPLDMEINLEK